MRPPLQVHLALSGKQSCSTDNANIKENAAPLPIISKRSKAGPYLVLPTEITIVLEMLSHSLKVCESHLDFSLLVCLVLQMNRSQKMLKYFF